MNTVNPNGQSNRPVASDRPAASGQSAASDRPLPALGGLGTGVGSLPHDDPAEASRIVLGELPELPFLPELPGRGPYATIIGRGTALLPGIDADLTTSGWRIGAGAGLEQGRATETLAADLDAFEAVLAAPGGQSGESVRSRPRVLKTQLAGPLTLASGLELPSGQSVLADPGALRDVAQSLAEGARSHLAELAGRLDVPVLLQLDEPGLPAVLTGSIRRPSGLGRYPAIEAEHATELLAEVLRATGAADEDRRSGAGDRGEGGRPVRTVVHCCADTVPVELLLDAGADAIGFDLGKVTVSQIDEYAMAVESGASLFVGAIPAVRPTTNPGERTGDTGPGYPGSGDLGGTAGTGVGPGSRRRSSASRILDWWGRLGFDEELAAHRIVVTTSCGSAGADPDWAVRALGAARETATQLAS